MRCSSFSSPTPGRANEYSHTLTPLVRPSASPFTVAHSERMPAASVLIPGYLAIMSLFLAPNWLSTSIHEEGDMTSLMMKSACRLGSDLSFPCSAAKFWRLVRRPPSHCSKPKAPELGLVAVGLYPPDSHCMTPMAAAVAAFEKPAFWNALATAVAPSFICTVPALALLPLEALSLSSLDDTSAQSKSDGPNVCLSVITFNVVMINANTMATTMTWGGVNRKTIVWTTLLATALIRRPALTAASRAVLHAW